MAKVRQGRLKGMEPPRIKVLDDAAEIYFAAMMDRVKMSRDEDEAKDNLIGLMKTNRMTIYETPDGLVVTITDKSNVKCKRKTEDNNNGEEE